MKIKLPTKVKKLRKALELTRLRIVYLREALKRRDEVISDIRKSYEARIKEILDVLGEEQRKRINRGSISEHVRARNAEKAVITFWSGRFCVEQWEIPASYRESEFKEKGAK